MHNYYMNHCLEYFANEGMIFLFKSWINSWITKCNSSNKIVIPRHFSDSDMWAFLLVLALVPRNMREMMVDVWWHFRWKGHARANHKRKWHAIRDYQFKPMPTILAASALKSHNWNKLVSLTSNDFMIKDERSIATNLASLLSNHVSVQCF